MFHEMLRRLSPVFALSTRALDAAVARRLLFVGGTSTAAALLVALVPEGPVHHWRAVVLLAALAALTPAFAVDAPRATVYDMAAVFVVAAAVLCPPGIAAIVGVPACAVDALRRRARPVAFVHNVAAIALAATLVSLLARAAASLPPVPEAAILTSAVCVYALVIVGLDALYGHVADRAGIATLPLALLGAEATLASLGMCLAALVRDDPVRAPFVLAPLLFVHRLQRMPALEREAARDVKTDLLNMRRFERELETLCGGQTILRPLSLLVIDLDHLREINNAHGHLAGDCVIRGVADLIRKQLRVSDLAARFGGEEFVVALADVDAQAARGLADRLRQAVATSLFHCNDPSFTARATVSIGIAQAPRDAATIRELLHAADVALLHAKATGRNRIVERVELTGARTLEAPTAAVAAVSSL
jgi:diguanylate cyclase (GGDEF)-like protein